MLAFVTVGSTKFDSLIQSIFSTSVLSSLREKGYTELVVQCGNSDFEHSSSLAGGRLLSFQRDGVNIEVWRFKPSLQDDYQRADLVISHAGSGTILEVLRLGKPMIAVPNPTLLHNHQEELAVALSDLGHLRSSRVSDLPRVIAEFDTSSVVPFPPFDGSKFARILDEEMGYL